MSAKKTVLVVEDETDLADVLRYNIEREGYACRCAADGERAMEEIRRRRPDVVILDRMLPRISGDQVIAGMRRDPALSGIPVLMLTAKAEESDELVGFALGADDYITKPFSMKLLVARIEALLRRAGAPKTESNVITVGDIYLDRDRRELAVDGQPVPLTATEFGILWELMSASERVLSRDQLINSVLGSTAVVTDRTIDVHVAALRKKLGPAARLIKTVRGVGYTFRQPSGEPA